MTSQRHLQTKSINQRLRTDLGRSDGETTGIQPAWLTGLRAQTSNPCNTM